MLNKLIYSHLFPDNNEIAKYPIYFHIETANRCNLHCKMCSRDKWGISDTNMSMEVFKKIISRIDRAELITLFGLGEPLMNPEIFNIVKACKEKGFQTAFTTNGYLLNKKNHKEVFSSGLDFIRFSIDSVEGGGNTTGHEYSKVVLKNIESFAALRGSGKKPEITFNTVVNAQNSSDVEKIILFAKKIGIDGVNLIAVVPMFASGYVKGLPLKEGIDIYKKLVEFGNGVKMPVWGSGFYAKSPGNLIRYRWKYCPRITNYLYINERGDCTPCCWIPRYKIGNIFEQTVEEIWKGKELKSFQENWENVCGSCNLMK